MAQSDSFSYTEQARRAAIASHAKTKGGNDKVRGVDPTTTEVEYTREEIEFSNAVQSYKHRTGRQFPTNREILAIALDLGYQKIGLSA